MNQTNDKVKEMANKIIATIYHTAIKNDYMLEKDMNSSFKISTWVAFRESKSLKLRFSGY